MFHANGNQKEARMAILVAFEIDTRSKTVIRDKLKKYKIIKGSILQVDCIPIYMK